MTRCSTRTVRRPSWRPRPRGRSTTWNDFIAPLILISDSEKAPLPLAVANLRQQSVGAVDYGATEAGVVVLAVPCLLLFLLLQRHYVRGFMSGALKG